MIRCPKCSHELADGTAFCDQCGHKLSPAPQAAPAATPSSGPAPATPPAKKRGMPTALKVILIILLILMIPVVVVIGIFVVIVVVTVVLTGNAIVSEPAVTPNSITPETAITTLPTLSDDYDDGYIVTVTTTSPAKTTRATTTTTVNVTTAKPTANNPRVLQTPSSALYSEARYKVVSSDGINLRYGPSTAYEVVRPVPNNQVVTVYAIEDCWMYCRLNDGTYGWASGAYLVEVSSVGQTLTVREARNLFYSIYNAETVWDAVYEYDATFRGKSYYAFELRDIVTDSYIDTMYVAVDGSDVFIDGERENPNGD